MHPWWTVGLSSGLSPFSCWGWLLPAGTSTNLGRPFKNRALPPMPIAGRSACKAGPIGSVGIVPHKRSSARRAGWAPVRWVWGMHQLASEFSAVDAALRSHHLVLQLHHVPATHELVSVSRGDFTLFKTAAGDLKEEIYSAPVSGGQRAISLPSGPNAAIWAEPSR